MSNKTIVVTAVAAMFAACSLDVPDLNNPSSSVLRANPTPALVSSAATGLLVGQRARVAIDNGYVAILGVLGREAVIFAASDPGFVTELLQGSPGLDPGSAISGSSFWLRRYRNIRDAFTLLHAADTVEPMSDADREAIRGFAKTIQALDFLVLVNTRDTNGAPIDVDRPNDAELAPIICKEGVFKHIATLLDEGRDHLQAAGDAFPFALGGGFDGFDTPAEFVKVNRAITARVEVYRGGHEAALAALKESFITADAADPQLSRGAYHVYGDGSGDALNELIAFTIYAHPSILADGEAEDARLSKVRVLEDAPEKPSEKAGVYQYTDPDEEFGSNVRFTIYPTNTTPVPIIRNEELILLRAEANLGVGSDTAIKAALADINFIRQHSGGLPALTGTDDPLMHGDSLLDELLHQRRYSLLFEGGHRWIDMRRHGKLDELPLDTTRHTVHERFPLPVAESDAREDNVQCQ